MAQVAVLHPGAMGSRLGAELVTAGHDVWWVPDGRSAASAERAAGTGMSGHPWPDLADADVVVACCAPQGALDVARSVAASGFGGVYVEANPVAPSTLEQIVAAVPSARAFVDAAVIGPPPRPGHGVTHLVLSGEGGGVETVADLWSGSAVLPQVAGERVGQASAAKAAFALYGKGRQALALLARELAASAGVADVLSAQGFRAGAEVLADDGLERSLGEVAWRWGPEFDEMAATAQSYGVDPAAVHALREVWRQRAREAS